MPENPPVVCDLSGAPDTGEQRLAEYGRLLQSAYLSRDRDPDGVRWLLRADPGIEAWARDLAAREMACCAFLTITVTRTGDEVAWHVSTFDDPAARAVLDLLYDLPDRRWTDVADVMAAWDETGAPLVIRES